MGRYKNVLALVLAMLAVALGAIALVAYEEVGHRNQTIRDQGTSLANALSRVPLARLAPDNYVLGPLSLIRSSMPHSDLLYGMIVAGEGPEGRIVAQVGDLPMKPTLALPRDPAGWSGDRSFPSNGGRPIREFVAPILTDGQLAGHIRIGFSEATFASVLSESQFFAMLGLVVFMASPIALFWLRRELRPLSVAVSQLEASDDGLAPGGQLVDAPTLAIEAIVERFHSLQLAMAERSDQMARERVALLASSRVVAHEKNRLQAMLEVLPDAVLALDEAGKVVLANARAEAVLRLSEEELVGAPPASWAPSEALVRLIGRYAGGGHTKRADGIEIALDEAGQRRFAATVHPFSSSAGAVVVLRDITAEHAERETQGEFLAHMAHELKAPLNVMSMYSESLLGPDAQDEAFRIDACNVIRDEIDRLNGLINNIFSIGRIESGNFQLDRQRVRTRELLSDVFEAVGRGDSELDLEFELTLPETMEPIFADKQLLSVAINNLLTNAIKYNRPEGKVSLTAEEDDTGLSIRIADTGIGIPEEDVDQVFEKFYRSESESARKVAGHGLGLSLVREIITLHGGEIRVTSELGAGSEFTFFFARNAAIFREES